ncbi:MAG: TrkA family potassium uptake protein [Chloroflexi bacterium]|nr:TrkA family potassium uptake protein [Chloroflexota bacterium]MBM3154992.1 TrkA family potassium uptake protein [Chloroflexota bacterium]MBM3172914.1 TrkA family potassium uptake protein [Chloroflexota bacterium]MBM3175244.1 TrkA family potassium uptake protein [Chloroflexota bacterium]MBM4451204.1 TrkA family potassium uptake protein [Chloroflexota bacterium]
MYIIIIGGGSVGYYLCKALLSEGHEVLVLDKDAGKCERFEDDMGSVCVRGDGCETATLAAAGASRADLLIATTNEDEDNLVACQVAKHQFGVPRTIARVNNPKNEKIFQKLGIDRTISITNLILEHIEGELPTHPLIHLLTMKEEGTEIVEVRVREGSEAVGKPIKKLHLPPDSFLVLLIRNGQKPRIITEDTVLQANDHVIALTPTASEDVLRRLFTGS